jgi:chromosome segregation ATPase
MSNVVDLGGVKFRILPDGTMASEEVEKLIKQLANADRGVQKTKDSFTELQKTAGNITAEIHPDQASIAHTMQVYEKMMNEMQALQMNVKLAVSESDKLKAKDDIKQWVNENEQIINGMMEQVRLNPEQMGEFDVKFINQFGKMKNSVGELDNAFEQMGDKVKSFFNSDIFLNNFAMMAISLLQKGLSFLTAGIQKAIEKDSEAKKAFEKLGAVIENIQMMIANIFLPIIKSLADMFNLLFGEIDEVNGKMKEFNEKGLDTTKLEKYLSYLELLKKPINIALNMKAVELNETMNALEKLKTELSAAESEAIPNTTKIQKLNQSIFDLSAKLKVLRTEYDDLLKEDKTPLKKNKEDYGKVNSALQEYLDLLKKEYEWLDKAGKSSGEKVKNLTFQYVTLNKMLNEQGKDEKEILDIKIQILDVQEKIKKNLGQSSESIEKSKHNHVGWLKATEDTGDASEELKNTWNAINQIGGAVLEQIKKLGPETEVVVKYLEDGLNLAAEIASGDVIGAIITGIKVIGEVIADVIGATDKWAETLKGVEELYADIRSKIVDSWSYMDKQVKLGDISLDEELAALKQQLKFAGFLNLSEEERLDLRLKIQGIEEQITSEKEKQTEEAEKQLELTKSQAEKELERQIKLGLIRAESFSGKEYIEQTLAGIGYAGSELYSRMADLGVTSSVMNPNVAIGRIETNFYDQSPNQVYRGMAGIVRDVTGGVI